MSILAIGDVCGAAGCRAILKLLPIIKKQEGKKPEAKKDEAKKPEEKKQDKKFEGKKPENKKPEDKKPENKYRGKLNDKRKSICKSVFFTFVSVSFKYGFYVFIFVTYKNCSNRYTFTAVDFCCG